MIAKRQKERAFRAVGEWTRRCGSALIAVAFVTSIIFGSASYIWCIPMAQAMSDCCCHEAMATHEHSSALADEVRPAVEAPCCETRHFEKLVTASVQRTEASSVPGPSWVVVPWAAVAVLDVPAQPGLLTSQPARAGPPPPKIPTYIRVRSLLI